MSEAEMYEQEEVAPRKKGLPTWLWVCGSGCLLMVVVGAAAVAWGIGKVKELADPDQQWPKIAEILPYEGTEPPDSLEFQFRWPLGLDMYMLQEKKSGTMGILMHMPSEDAEETRKMMLSLEGGIGQFGKRKELTPFTIEIDGREVPGARFYQDQGGGSSDSKVQAGYSAMLDLTRDGEVRPLLLQLVRPGDSDISDEEILSFLAPFDVSKDGF